MKLTIIGAGNIGNAIACGLGSSKRINKLTIWCTDIQLTKLVKIKDANASIQVSTDNIVAIKDADIVMVAVKPW
jgi:pyrroline-5-carboxylate reductase